jgi:hypothetical protein
METLGEGGTIQNYGRNPVGTMLVNSWAVLRIPGGKGGGGTDGNYEMG